MVLRKPAYLPTALAIVLSLSVVPAGAAAAAPVVPSSSGYTLEVLAYEGFDYPTGNLVPNSGGDGWTADWSKSYSLGGDYQVSATGLTYPGLTVTGGSIEWGSGGNQLNGARRTLPRVHEGVVYLRFLSHFTSQTGLGTPNLRLADDSTGSWVRTGGIGGNGAPDMAIMDSNLSPVASSGVTMNQLNLTIVRFDYDGTSSSIWMNPDLSTFDYVTPPTPDASVAGFAPTFSAIDPYTRIGSKVDEITVLRLVPPSPEPPKPKPAGPPQDVTAVAGDRSAQITWNPPSTSGSYRISNYLVTSNPGRLLCLTATTTCAYDGLVNGTTYTFTVQALTGAGWGATSAVSNAIAPGPPPPPPPPPTPEIEIDGKRAEARSRPGIVLEGAVSALEPGTVLQPWLRFGPDQEFRGKRARIEVGPDGTFTWERPAPAYVEAYFTTLDGAVRSNTVRITGP